MGVRVLDKWHSLYANTPISMSAVCLTQFGKKWAGSVLEFNTLQLSNTSYCIIKTIFSFGPYRANLIHIQLTTQ